MRNFRTILIIGTIEILIGSITICFTFGSIVLGTNKKEPSVLFAVFIAACISTLIGVGILKFKKIAYQLLLYFSSVIILSKILIFLNVIHLNGALETTIPSAVKNSISMAYHGFVIYYLRQESIKKIFHIE